MAGKISAQDIIYLMGKQNKLCFYCHIDISTKYHIDHYMPIKLGGVSNIENIVLSCPNCNWRKKYENGEHAKKHRRDYMTARFVFFLTEGDGKRLRKLVPTNSKVPRWIREQMLIVLKRHEKIRC